MSAVVDMIPKGTLHPVSEIPGRSDLEDTLKMALRSEEAADGVGVSMFDVTGFKLINDEHGFHNGDAALKTIAELFVQNYSTTTERRRGLRRRASDRTVLEGANHLAGDEYTYIHRGVASKEELDEQTEIIISKVLKGHTLQSLATDLIEARMFEEDDFQNRGRRQIGLGLRAGNVMLSDAITQGDTPQARLNYVQKAWDPKTHKVVQIEGLYGPDGLESLVRTHPTEEILPTTTFIETCE